jgi:hypothetical protein
VSRDDPCPVRSSNRRRRRFLHRDPHVCSTPLPPHPLHRAAVPVRCTARPPCTAARSSFFPLSFARRHAARPPLVLPPPPPGCVPAWRRLQSSKWRAILGGGGHRSGRAGSAVVQEGCRPEDKPPSTPFAPIYRYDFSTLPPWMVQRNPTVLPVGTSRVSLPPTPLPTREAGWWLSSKSPLGASIATL